jgi:hypothetical protein
MSPIQIESPKSAKFNQVTAKFEITTLVSVVTESDGRSRLLCLELKFPYHAAAGPTLTRAKFVQLICNLAAVWNLD